MHKDIHNVSFINDLWHMLFIFLYTGKITRGQSRKNSNIVCAGKGKKTLKNSQRSIKDLEHSLSKLATISKGNVACVCHC